MSEDVVEVFIGYNDIIWAPVVEEKITLRLHLQFLRTSLWRSEWRSSGEITSILIWLGLMISTLVQNGENPEHIYNF